MLKMAMDQGLAREGAISGNILVMKHIGADLVVTYFALYLARKIDEGVQ